MNLAGLKALFYGAGCTQLYAKRLAGNDNSKNQVYFGPGFGALNLFPHDDVAADGKPGNATFKAKVRFGWLLLNGQVAEAPGAQMILYPQYPEVRFSGFLKGASHAPSDLMTSREPGRVLFLGVHAGGKVIGYAASPDSQEARELEGEKGMTPSGVFLKLVLRRGEDDASVRSKVVAALRKVSEKGWIDSKQLDKDGMLKPCNAPQCGGFTLEAELGVPKNSAAEPDYLGWEIKQHAVGNFNSPASGASITLMTPEPTAGYYKEYGVERFVREFGYPDMMGRPDRMNFGGVHKIGMRHDVTGLTLQLSGYDASSKAITDASGALALIDDRGRIAAAWGFAGLLSHWSRKHAKAVYIPSKSRNEPTRQYSYGPKVRMAEGTDSLRLLKAFALGFVFYDPGIKLENISKAPKVKRRSQFRIASKSIPELYESVALVDVFADG
jgi:hypothetical protein